MKKIIENRSESLIIKEKAQKETLNKVFQVLRVNYGFSDEEIKVFIEYFDKT